MSNYKMTIICNEKPWVEYEIIESKDFPKVDKNYTLKNGKSGILVSVENVINKDRLLKAIDDC